MARLTAADPRSLAPLASRFFSRLANLARNPATDLRARGFLLKSDAGRDLMAAVEAMQHRRTFFTPRVAQMLLDGYLRPEENETLEKRVLTPREREVIQLVAEGKTTKEVATALSLSVKTAETHRTNLMRKLDLHSIADLTLYAVRNGIVQVY